MTTVFDFDQMVWMNVFDKVLENDEAMLVHFHRGGSYMAISKQVKGQEYTYSGLYYNSTRGNYQRCKKAFEKYSPKMMARYSKK